MDRSEKEIVEITWDNVRGLHTAGMRDNIIEIYGHVMLDFLDRLKAANHGRLPKELTDRGLEHLKKCCDNDSLEDHEPVGAIME